MSVSVVIRDGSGQVAGTCLARHPESCPMNNENTNCRLDYPDQLHVWVVGLRLGVFGRMNTDEHDLLIDRGLAVIELNRHLDHGVVITEASLRTVVETFRYATAPYPSAKPPAIYKIKPEKKPRTATTRLTRREVDELGPHLRGHVVSAL